jgi:glycosyltransferase involved in cell wall biosynthesis
MPMNILVIPTTDWLRHPTPHRHHYLAEQMVENNNVYVFYFNLFSGKKTWKTKAKLLPARGMTYDNLLLYYSLNAPIHFFKLRKYIKKKKIDVIYGAHPVTNLIALLAVKSLGKKNRPLCVFDFNDFFPEGASLYFSNPLVQKSIQKISEKILILNLKKADLVVPVSLIMKEYAIGHGVKNIELITNGVDTRLFNPNAPTEKIKNKYGLGNNVIGFVGTVERWFSIEMLLDSFKHVVEQVPDAQLLIVGGSIKTDYLEQLKKRAHEFGLGEKVIFTGVVPYEEVPSYMNCMALGVIPPISKNLFMGKIALPNKLFQYSACGIPILTYPMPEIVRVGGDAINTYESEEEYVRKSVVILKNKNENVAGIDFASKYDWRNQCKNLLGLFRKNLEEMDE